jgi:SAM-dependent methyltransferase
MDLSPEMQTLKTRLKATWMAGDYGHFAKYLEPGALEIFARLNIKPGERLLDVACGAGQLAFPAARSGAIVTGVDIAANLIEQARARAAAEGLNIRFDEGDAEALPYPDESFDTVLSLIGAMFAPRPERVAAELVRVCRPGGRLIMINWTPDSFVGQMFKVNGKHLPPPPNIPPPVLWGDEATVQERLSAGLIDLQMTRRHYPFKYPFNVPEVIEFYRAYYGPTQRAFAALDEMGQAALRRDLEALWSSHNRAADGTTYIESEYLEIQAVRA